MNEWQADLRAKAKQWLTYGDEDLRLAEHALVMNTSIPYRLVAYHAQQCAEKYLKAFLVVHNIDFPFTHNISLLLEYCSGVADWPGSLESAEELTVFAITTRYPGEDTTVSREEALRAIDLAKSVQAAARQALADQGVL